jgi:hypothetical protein
MKVTILPILLGTLPFLVNSRSIEVEFERRQNKETQTEYDQTSVALNQQGACCSFASSDAALTAKCLATCQGKCGDLAKQDAQNDKISSVTCLAMPGPGIPSYTDPDGNAYIIGECLCDIPILDQVIEDVIMALPAISEIGCERLKPSESTWLETQSSNETSCNYVERHFQVTTAYGGLRISMVTPSVITLRAEMRWNSKRRYRILARESSISNV